MKVTYEISGRFIELYYDSMPEENVRETMKALGWRWYGKKRCWSHFNNSENLEFAKSIVDEYKENEIDPIKLLPQFDVDVDKVVVRSNGFYCNKNHGVIDIAGQVHLVNKKGNIITDVQPMAYCFSCNTFFILEETYKDLQKKGRVLAQVFKYESYLKDRERISEFNAEGWKDESVLKICGYSVSTADGLSSRERQAILGRILDKNVMTKDRMLSYLDLFCRMSAFPDAIAKWTEDRKYISQYKSDAYVGIRI